MERGQLHVENTLLPASRTGSRDSTPLTRSTLNEASQMIAFFIGLVKSIEMSVTIIMRSLKDQFQSHPDRVRQTSNRTVALHMSDYRSSRLIRNEPTPVSWLYQVARPGCPYTSRAASVASIRNTIALFHDVQTRKAGPIHTATARMRCRCRSTFKSVIFAAADHDANCQLWDEYVVAIE